MVKVSAKTPPEVAAAEPQMIAHSPGTATLERIQ
jgi:hypothetical protein